MHGFSGDTQGRTFKADDVGESSSSVGQFRMGSQFDQYRSLNCTAVVLFFICQFLFMLVELVWVGKLYNQKFDATVT